MINLGFEEGMSAIKEYVAFVDKVCEFVKYMQQGPNSKAVPVGQAMPLGACAEAMISAVRAGYGSV